MQKLKDFIYYNRKTIIIITIISTIFLIYVMTTLNEKDNFEEEITIEENIEPEKESSQMIIDIKGEVNSPGTYEFEENKRVIDAINKAGGLTKKADTEDINLSEKLTDEMLIIIPSKEEKEKQEKEITSNSNNASTNESVSHTQTSDGKISINTANISELTKLSGIGESKARSIIEYREKNGKFKTIEDIKKVSGIGNSTFDKIKDNIKI